MGDNPSATTVAVGRDRIESRDPRLAFGLALVVGLLVFVALLWVRRTFGLKR